MFLVAQLVKNLPAMWETWVGDLGSIPGLGRFPGEGKGYPHQHSGLENSMDCVELQSMGLQRVGHNQATFTFTFICAKRFVLVCNKSTMDLKSRLCLAEQISEGRRPLSADIKAL